MAPTHAVGTTSEHHVVTMRARKPVEARGAFEPGREDDRIQGQEPHPATFATMLDLLGDYRGSFS